MPTVQPYASRKIRADGTRRVACRMTRLFTQAQADAFERERPGELTVLLQRGEARIEPDFIAIAKANRALGDPHWRDLPGKPLTSAQKRCLGGDA